MFEITKRTSIKYSIRLNPATSFDLFAIYQRTTSITTRTKALGSSEFFVDRLKQDWILFC